MLGQLREGVSREVGRNRHVLHRCAKLIPNLFVNRGNDLFACEHDNSSSYYSFHPGRKAMMPLAKMNENDCRFNHGVEQLPSDFVRLGMPVKLFALQNARGNALIEFEQFGRALSRHQTGSIYNSLGHQVRLPAIIR
jgi:PhoPQ-activated pathogenicity-related protein